MSDEADNANDEVQKQLEATLKSVKVIEFLVFCLNSFCNINVPSLNNLGFIVISLSSEITKKYGKYIESPKVS